MVVLGIETTCDETAAAVVERPETGPGNILSNVVLSQINEHAAFGGVVPEIAARAHVEALDMIIAKAMAEARCHLRRPRRRRRRRRTRPDRRRDRGPHHRQGDRAGQREAADGGQSSRGPRPHRAAHRRHAVSLLPVPRRPAATRRSLRCSASANTCGSAPRVDDAIGEAFDKTAKLLGLGYPGGPQVEKEALVRQSRALCAAAADDRTAARRLLALRAQDRAAGRGGEDRAALPRGRARSLRLVPAIDRRGGRRPAARRA